MFALQLWQTLRQHLCQTCSYWNKVSRTWPRSIAIRALALMHRQVETKIQGDKKKKKDYWKLIIYCRKTLSNWLGCFINYRFLWDEIRYWYCKLSHLMSYLMLPFAKINWTAHSGQSSFKMLLCCLSTAEQFALNWIPYIQNLCLKKKNLCLVFVLWSLPSCSLTNLLKVAYGYRMSISSILSLSYERKPAKPWGKS